MTYRSSNEQAVEQLEQEVEQLRLAVEEQAIDLTDATQRLQAKIEETENLRAQQVSVLRSLLYSILFLCSVLLHLFCSLSPRSPSSFSHLLNYLNELNL